MVENSWLSLLPFLTVIPLAVWLKEILPGLAAGLLIGSYIVNPTWLGGLTQAVTYIVDTLSAPDNIKIIAFLYLFGGLVGMMQITGGIKGFAEWMSRRIKTERGILWFIWLTLPFTFITPMFRIMMIGPVVKSLMGRFRIPREKIGLTMDISTEPFIVLLPVATAFVGFMVSVVGGAMGQNQLSGSAYHMFLTSLPFNFFAIIGLAAGLFITFRGASPAEKKAEQREISEDMNEFHEAGIKQELSLVRAQPWNLIIPLILLLVSTFYFLWQDGRMKGAETFLSALSKADATFVMLMAVFLTILLTTIYYLVRRQKLNEVLYHFFDGGNRLVTAIILLVLVWSVSLAAKDLGFAGFIASTLGSFLPGFMVPAVTFLLGAFVSYFIGSSWGAWGLFMPLGVALAAAAGGSVTMTVGAVFASGTFGAFASPLGDTTITTASVLEMPLVRYAAYKLKISLIIGVLTFLLYLGAGYLYSG